MNLVDNGEKSQATNSTSDAIGRPVQESLLADKDLEDWEIT